MQVTILEVNGVQIAEVISDSIVINTPQEALNLIANCSYQGAQGIIVSEINLAPVFFDLKTRVAGENSSKIFYV